MRSLCAPVPASLRSELLAESSSDHHVLYAVPNVVARGFTKTYLSRATGKLQALLDRPRLKSTDAEHGEQLEREEGDEWRQAALQRMEVHSRARAIYAGRRIGWREKLNHAQVQRGIEARKEQEGRRRAPVSEASRAAMKRRGKDDSDEEPDGDAEKKEAELDSEGSGAAPAASASSSSAAYIAPSGSDFFLASIDNEKTEADLAKQTLVNEHTLRIKEMLDGHTPSHYAAASSHSPTQSGRGLHGKRKGHVGGVRKNATGDASSAAAASSHAAGSAASPAPSSDSDGGESKEGMDNSMPATAEGGRRRMNSSASAPVLPSSTRNVRTPSSRQNPDDRWKHVNGLHPANMHSTAASALKLVPKLPVHTGLAAEDVLFRFDAVPSLFVDTHTALEIACSAIHFSHFKSRHKQIHYLLLSPDNNYLCLLVFWYLFLKYFQSSAVEPRTPAMIARILENLGRKWREMIRYTKIHLALHPEERLSSWYDQFEGQEVALGSMVNLDDTPKNKGGSAKKKNAARGSLQPIQERNSLPHSSSSSMINGSVGHTTRLSTASIRFVPPAQPAFDPFTCVPSYPPELFTDSMEQLLRPKTRSGTHHQLERFLLLLPFVLSSACYELLRAFFPESAHFLTPKLRMRLDAELHQMLGGLELSEITLRKQREKFMREVEERPRTAGTNSAATAATRPATGAAASDASSDPAAATDDGSAPAFGDDEKPTFESLFAFNAVVNPSATRGGLKFHSAMINPNHTSIPGSAILLGNAKKLGMAALQKSASVNALGVASESAHGGMRAVNPETLASPTPLTRHTRLGGVLHQDVVGRTITIAPGTAGSGDGGAGDSPERDEESLSPTKSEWDSPTRAVGGPGSPLRINSPVPFSPASSSAALGSGLAVPSSPLPPSAVGPSLLTPPKPLPISTFASPLSPVRSGGQGQQVITSSRAFTFGTSSASAQAGMAIFGSINGLGGVGGVQSSANALLAATIGSPPFSPGGSGGNGKSLAASASAPVLPSSGGGDGAHLADEKARRRAREKPQKGSLHSTGDWSRDERERRDFLKRMAARHATLEKSGQKERDRNDLRASRLVEGGSAEHEEMDSAAAYAAYQRQQQQQQHQQADDSDPRGFRAPIPEEDDVPSSARAYRGASESYDPISSAFQSVLGHSISDVPTTVAPAAISGLGHSRSPSRMSPAEQTRRMRKQSNGGSLSYSASTPALTQPTMSRQPSDTQQSSGTRPSTGSRTSPDRPTSASGSPPSLGPRSGSLSRHRPGAISLQALNSTSNTSPAKTAEPRTANSQGAASSAAGDHMSRARAKLSSQTRESLAQAAAEDHLQLNTHAAAGFTASDLSLPLQSMLLTEENLRHAQQLRPPTVKLNINALTPVTSLALHMRLATPSWGSGLVLRHSNPIPRQLLGEDLGDGFAFVPPPSAVSMDNIAFTADAAAKESQARLLAEYKQLHRLQQADQQLKGAHAGSNLEHGDPARALRRGEKVLRGGGHAHSASLASMAGAGSAFPASGEVEPALFESAAPTPAASGVPPVAKKKPLLSTLHKTSKLDALLADAKQVHWSGGIDDPTLFLTPRTKQILQQVEGNKAKHEQERKAREQEMKEALEKAQ